MSEAPVKKAPVTTDPASAPPHPQQRQDQLQDTRQDQRQDPRQDARQEQRQDQQASQRSAQQAGQPQHLAHDPARDATRESAKEASKEASRESVRESARETTQGSSQDNTSQRPVGRLEDEWQAVQYEFVDDPKSAVRKADDLVQRAIQELTSRHRTLSQQWQGEGKHETEDLRLALHRYRELFKSLVAVK